MSRPVCSECLCVIDETGCGCVQPIEPFTNHEQGEKMNANELIDLLHTEDVQFSQQSVNDWAEEAVTMLRQQQAEIEFLKKEILEKHEDWKHEGQQAANARAEIEALKAHPVKELTDEEIIESLAELEHEQWMKWADTIMQTEKISDARFARWASCMIPYADLTEEMKEFDREWARKALAILRKAQE